MEDDYIKFLKWLANSVLDEEWDKEHDIYTEAICKKLVNLGFLKVEDGIYLIKE